jgi:hypothetical protein
VITALPDGTLVQLLGGRADAAGRPWLEVSLPDGRVGWVAEAFVVPYQTFRLP